MRRFAEKCGRTADAAQLNAAAQAYQVSYVLLWILLRLFCRDSRKRNTDDYTTDTRYVGSIDACLAFRSRDLHLLLLMYRFT